MSRRRPSFRDPHYWTMVEVGLHCALGDHQVGRGEWVRRRRGDPFRRNSCATCLAKAGITRPQHQRPVTFAGAAPEDHRARQVGDKD